jgi:two-component system, NtrC family, sensor kinase
MKADQSLPLLSFLVDRIEVGVFAVDRAGTIALWNRFMADHSGRSADQAIGAKLVGLFPELPQRWLQKKIDSVFVLKNYAFTSWEQRPYLFRFHHNRPVTGGIDAMRQNITFLPLKDEAGEVSLVCATVFDYTDTAIYQNRLQEVITALELEKAEQRRLIGKLEEAHNQLLQSEKLAAIGQLAAGVAHEINNPIGFVSSNMSTLEKYLEGLMRLVTAYDRLGESTDLASRRSEIAKIKQEIDFEFLSEDVSALLGESRDGLLRVRKIVQDLRDFSRVDTAERDMADLRNCLDSTLNIVSNELKYRADVVKEYAEIPLVDCVPSQLNQVFMNLMINAAHAIPADAHGTITLATGSTPEAVWAEIRDNGCGIPPDRISRIFEPFYTTKPVGSGTGLGLSISYSIVRKHGGRIEVDTEPGRGTAMRVWLPLDRTVSA